MAHRSTTAAGTRLFGIDIAGEVSSGIASAGGALDATLTKRTAGTRTALDLAGGTNPVQTAYACKGFRSESAGAGARVLTVRLLGATILNGTDRIVPEPGDLITIGGETRAISTEPGSVKHDAAAAVYTCTCGGPGPGIAR